MGVGTCHLAALNNSAGNFRGQAVTIFCAFGKEENLHSARSSIFSHCGKTICKSYLRRVRRASNMPKSYESLLDEEDTSLKQLIDEDPQDDEDDSRKRRNILTLIITSSLSMLGFGIYGTAYSQWIYVRFEMDALGASFSKLDRSAAKDPCFRGNGSDSPLGPLLMEAQANSAHFSMLTMLCALIPSFFTNLLLGAYADQIGRRLIFIVPLTGYLIRVANVCAVAYWNLDVRFILIGYIICGLAGDFAAYVMALYVYTADNTTKGKNRSFLMVLTSAVSWTCSTLSHFASGYFIEAVGYVWPMVTGLAVITLSFVLTVLLLQETLDKSKVKKVSLCQGIKGIFSFYFDEPVNPLFKRKDFILLGLVFFAFSSSLGSQISTIFLMNEPFCWGSRQMGIVNSSFGLAHSVLSTIVMRLMQMFFSDEILVITSLLSSVANRFVFAFAQYDWQIYIGYGVGALEVSVLAVVRAILSRMVPQEKRGSLFASLAVMETATVAASGAGLNEMYSKTVNHWRGLTYFVIGCITVVSAIIMIIYKIMVYKRESSSTTVSIELELTQMNDLDKRSNIATISDGVEKLQAENLKENQVQFAPTDFEHCLD
ncbi:hypothetical protein RRG08_034836 [Elysia crispata]|uniref:Major facilitator superfamily (MFS) profile domain-containing protein n=1 Tax=Elysia crispata TaxID=231223 RepID=A0AAE1E2C6_9GAST|nr:hypothetical protein RRG08_034836 [Elysia crispata]